MTAHAIESKPRKAMNPDRLRKFIDSPSVANATRNVPMAIVKRQTQVTSWNGEQCDVRAFEKLAPSAHVILAKDLRSCAIGKGKPVALVPSGLQINDVTVLPKDQQLQDQLTAPLMTKKETFAHAAEIEHRAVPGSVILKEGIMTPQQRRERLHFETDHLHAKRALHRADTNDRRLHQIIKERHSTFFVAVTTQQELPVASIRAKTAMQILGYSTTTGYSTKHHSTGTSKAQNLRNQSTAGRSFNIVNGGRVEHFPPTIPEKQHQWQTHPSVSIHPYTR
ncbi:hypothetical protein AM588_10001567 [Phytophthora nicotianae]|uniref:Uncharacterized protein n=1 Tax=Phytophthora nicotianae TaxID=4792 RepID=A0A0W8CTU2_PHYNI|nr:hypothetical protein AM588_10001567 [Phytophthora nicotianae]